jgi:hypothetical protein
MNKRKVEGETIPNEEVSTHAFQTSLPIRIGTGHSDKPAKKKVQVRTRPSDNLGAAPLPEGYFEHMQSLNTKKINIPVSYQDNKRYQQESRPYVAPISNAKKNKTLTVRAAGGELWKDESLADWDENDYRLFVGDLGNEVNDALLAKSFQQYRSLTKVHVVRDKKSAKSKGFGFLSFSDPDDFIKAMREMNGKYVGNRPIKLSRSKWKDRMADEGTMAKQRELAEVAKKSLGTGKGGK